MAGAGAPSCLLDAIIETFLKFEKENNIPETKELNKKNELVST